MAKRKKLRCIRHDIHVKEQQLFVMFYVMSAFFFNIRRVNTYKHDNVMRWALCLRGKVKNQSFFYSLYLPYLLLFVLSVSRQSSSIYLIWWDKYIICMCVNALKIFYISFFFSYHGARCKILKNKFIGKCLFMSKVIFRKSFIYV